VRKLFEGLARTQPLVVVFEDLHWAEPTFFDLVEYVAGFSTGRPIMLLVSARPELLEARPGWGRPGPRSNLLYLSRLDDHETNALIDALLPDRGGLADRRRLIEAA
jgi:predicted ATPase